MIRDIFFLFLGLCLAASIGHADALGPVTAADLSGIWISKCAPSESISQSSQMTFGANGEVTNQSNVYVDAQCGKRFDANTSRMIFNLSEDGLSATTVPVETTLEFDTQAGVDAANQYPGACKMTNWVVGVSRSVLGTDCGPRDKLSFLIGKVDADTMRLTICQTPSNCQSVDYARGN